jgi:hypothetical protein
VDCAGDVVCGSPDSGKVDLHTSEFYRLPCVDLAADVDSLLFLTALQLYSATKLVTTVSATSVMNFRVITDLSLSLQVACLQLVDRGMVSLDDPADVNKHLPELAEFQILKGYGSDGKAILEDQSPKGTITLRILLSHTSGMSYVSGGQSKAESR